MKKPMIILLALLGSAALISSCSKDQPVVYSMTSQDFVTRSASYFNFQIQAGNLAKSKGVNDSVKSYGTVMISDNTAAYAALKTLATSKSLTISTTLQANDQTNLNSLASQSSAAFDQSYAQMMILTHNQEIALFNLADQSNGVADMDLRTFSFNQLPLLSLRLQSAYSLQTIVTKQ
jgi:putative membrane protein